MRKQKEEPFGTFQLGKVQINIYKKQRKVIIRNMNDNDASKFFECIGEIWRDITTIEFLMRTGIARKDDELDKFPKPPYIKGLEYANVPDSFGNYSFEIIVNKFNKRYPNIQIPLELIELRNAMAHGIISKIGDNSYETLIKFRQNDSKKSLEVAFSLDLKTSTLLQLRQSLKELRRFISIEVGDKN